MKKFQLILAVLVIASIFLACSKRYFRSTYRDHNALLYDADSLKQVPFIKAHLHDGSVYVLKDQWTIDTTTHTLSGTGKLFDYNRLLKEVSYFDIDLNDVSLIETNEELGNINLGQDIAMTIFATASIAGGLYCLINPKACFGSCPTFYLNEEDDFHFADAEGFSNAILPSMEYADIDALDNQHFQCGTLSITMKNEALETHCINELKLLAIPRKEGQRVFHTTDDAFHVANTEYRLHKAELEGIDLSHLVCLKDRNEWYSSADGQNLSSKEEMILAFHNVKADDKLGLSLSFRQTLMTTYFIYSAMGYMGDEVSDIFAQIEREGMNGKMNGLKDELGEIDVYVWNQESENWEFQGGYYETGPIAFNHQMIPLQAKHSGNVKIKLVMNKGLWRIDHVGLYGDVSERSPIELFPEDVRVNGLSKPKLLSQLENDKQYLVSLPGDAFKINFSLPEEDLELFLYSKGYYLEWMRESWIKDKDLYKLHEMFSSPKKYLRDEAESFKEYEKTMEEQFWNSKIDKNLNSYENLNF